MTINATYNSDEPFVWVRFDGPELDIKTVPIYDLGHTFMAIQRLINKSYLFTQRQTTDIAKLTDEERQKLALRISSRERGSDIYGLAPFLMDFVVNGLLPNIVASGLLAIGDYAHKRAVSRKLLNKSHHKADTPIQTTLPYTDDVALDDAEPISNPRLLRSINSEVVELVNRIDNVSYIKVIEIRGGQYVQAPPVKLDSNTKQYVKQIQKATVLGELLEIEGFATNIDISRQMVEIQIESGNTVKVRLNNKDIDIIIKHIGEDKKQVFLFSGWPVLEFGSEGGKFSEFATNEVKIKHSKGKFRS